MPEKRLIGQRSNQNTQPFASSRRSAFKAATGSITNSPFQTGQPSLPLTTRPFAREGGCGPSYATNLISLSVTRTGIQPVFGLASFGRRILFLSSAQIGFIAFTVGTSP